MSGNSLKTGWTIKGVCGKTEETSNIQDLLMFACQELSDFTIEARKQGIDTNAESKHITNCLFMDNVMIVTRGHLCIEINRSFEVRRHSKLDTNYHSQKAAKNSTDGFELKNA